MNNTFFLIYVPSNLTRTSPIPDWLDSFFFFLVWYNLYYVRVSFDLQWNGNRNGKKIDFFFNFGIRMESRLWNCWKCCRTQVFECHEAFRQSREVIENLTHASRPSNSVNDDNVKKVKETVLKIVVFALERKQRIFTARLILKDLNILQKRRRVKVAKEVLHNVTRMALQKCAETGKTKFTEGTERPSQLKLITSMYIKNWMM